MSDAEHEELEELRREMQLNALGDRPHSVAVCKLKRLMDLEFAARKSYCGVCRSYHELVASKCPAMAIIV